MLIHAFIGQLDPMIGIPNFHLTQGDRAIGNRNPHIVILTQPDGNQHLIELFNKLRSLTGACFPQQQQKFITGVTIETIGFTYIGANAF